jgi:hypothetical protein
VATCSGGTIVGYILGNYGSSLQFTATDTNCYVTTYTTVSPSIGSLLTVSSFGDCCPTPTPTPSPAPPTQNIQVRECGTASPTYGITINVSGLIVGLAEKMNGGSGVLNGKCWEIIDASYGGTIDYTATHVSTSLSCASCTPDVTPTPTPTGTPTPTPAPLIVANGTYTCSTGTNCDGEFLITSVSGGSGAPYQTSYVVSGNPPSWNNYPATNLYTGLCGGTNYVLSLKDSSGFIRTADPNTQCSVTPTPTPTGTPTPTPTGTPTPTPSPEYTINWINNSVTTGTNTLTIYKNGTMIVNQSGLGSGSFTVTSSDSITYSLFSTTPDFTSATVYVNFVANTDCGFQSAFVEDIIGFNFTANGTITGDTQNYGDACP